MDLTNALEIAVNSEIPWSYFQASQVANKLSGLSSQGSVNGGPNENWLMVFHEGVFMAYVYQLAPFVIADVSLKPIVQDDFEEVSFFFGIIEDKDIYRIDPAKAAKLMPYPLDEIDLNFEAFEITDFIYETAS